MPKKILIEVPDETVTRLRKQAKATGRSITAQTTHLAIVGAMSDPVTPLTVALRNIYDHAIPCTGGKNYVVSSTFIRAARKLLGVK